MIISSRPTFGLHAYKQPAAQYVATHGNSLR
jgi:hypothetical protein